MSEDIQKQPQGADGGDGLSQLFGQQRGSQVSPQQPSGGAGKSDGQPQYATREDLKAFRDEVLNEAVKKAQSISDKSASVSQKAYQEVKAEIERLKNIGVTLTPVQEQELRDQKLTEAMNREAQTSGEPATQNIDKGQPPVVVPPAWLKRDVDTLIQNAGFELLPQELSQAGLSIELMEENPRQFYETYREALSQKHARLAQGGQISRGAVPGLTGSGQSVGLEAQYKNEYLAARGNARKMRDIRQRYQSMGLDTSKVKMDI